MNNKEYDEYEGKVIEALKQRNVTRVCPRCSQGMFHLVGISHIPTGKDLQKIAKGDVSIPVANVCCSYCGFIMQHAIKKLGLMSPNTELVK